MRICQRFQKTGYCHRSVRLDNADRCNATGHHRRYRGTQHRFVTSRCILKTDSWNVMAIRVDLSCSRYTLRITFSEVSFSCRTTRRSIHRTSVSIRLDSIVRATVLHGCWIRFHSAVQGSDVRHWFLSDWRLSLSHPFNLKYPKLT